MVQLCRAAPTFDFCPILVTGGVDLNTMPAAFDSGAAIVGSGFDLLLKNESPSVSVSRIAGILKDYVDAAREHRYRKWPHLENAKGSDDDTWLDTLPHYHPFHKEI